MRRRILILPTAAVLTLLKGGGRRRAEQVAVKMLFPVRFCFFPANFVVIGPAVPRFMKVF